MSLGDEGEPPQRASSLAASLTSKQPIFTDTAVVAVAVVDADHNEQPEASNGAAAHANTQKKEVDEADNKAASSINVQNSASGDCCFCEKVIVDDEAVELTSQKCQRKSFKSRMHLTCIQVQYGTQHLSVSFCTKHVNASHKQNINTHEHIHTFDRDEHE